MGSIKYCHRCIVCGEPRSEAFHKRHPAGRGIPVIKGICGECRKTWTRDSQPVHVHIHHHHWYAQEATESRSRQSQTLETPPSEHQIPELPDNELSRNRVNHRDQNLHFSGLYSRYNMEDHPPPVGPKPQTMPPHIAFQERANTY